MATQKKKAPAKASAAKPAAKKSKAKSSAKATVKKGREAVPKKSAISDNPSKSPARVGAPVPELTLANVEGRPVNLKEAAQKSRHLVLYFYPKDDTPGCTKQACDFRDQLSHLTQHGATVIGVSPDPKESHKNFITKYDLNFDLLTDEDHSLSERMGVWKQKQFMGNSYMGVERSTFLFTDGKLKRVWQPVAVEGHVSEVLDALHGD